MLRFRWMMVIILFLISALKIPLHSVEHRSPKPDAPTIDNDFVQKAFGPSCKLMEIQPIVADFNGDGVDDIVIPARCTNPMSDQTENNFVVLDPYYSFFGYGNTKVTTQFSTDIPEVRSLSLLVIHGAGKDAWRSATPLAKFAIVNLPFKQVTVKKLKFKKKKVMAIYIEEMSADQMTSAMFWDGKKYRYEPMGSTME